MSDISTPKTARRCAAITRLLFALPLLAAVSLTAPAHSQDLAPQPALKISLTGESAEAAKDRAEAMRLDRVAARQGDAQAQARLGVFYFAGWGGVEQDDAEALKWLGLAARQNHARAQAYLGILYAQGRGVDRNPVVAQVWFNLAATQGDRLGQLIGPKNAAELNVGEIAQAARRAREWREAYAASRADALRPASGGDGATGKAQ